MSRWLLSLWLASFAVVWPTQADPARSTTQQLLERLAASTTSFATREIVSNQWIEEQRWPADLLAEQQNLVAALRSLADRRTELQSLLGSADPRIRTLALGALFVREDPQDLPLMAGMISDDGPTFKRAGTWFVVPNFILPGASSYATAPPPQVAWQFEGKQTVGQIAREMIGFYLDAAGQSVPSDVRFVSPAFTKYWAERSGRVDCASWFLVKMRRATRQSSPLNPAHEPDVRRVLAQIDALPPIERAWTLLYVRTDQGQIDTVLPDAALVSALRAVGPEALLTFLRREAPTDDPDVRAGPAYPGSRTGFILDYAPKLLRASDADAVTASAQAYRTIQDDTRFVAAAARLRGLKDAAAAGESLKAHILRIPAAGVLGVSDQAVLAFSLWQLRGATERVFLADWFYTVVPFSRSPDALEYFLLDVDKEARPDTSQLLAAIVNDTRFESLGWSALARILEMVNKTLPSPLVRSATIYNYMPNSQRPDEEDQLAVWRRLLRQHFRSAR